MRQKSTKYYSSVAVKGKELSYLKQCHFVDKVNEAYKAFLEQGLNYNLDTICKIIANSPAPRFYVGVSLAMLEYSRYKKGISAIRRAEARKMYAEIFARYEQLVRIAVASGQIVRKYETMRRVLEQEAPSFYYSDISALKTYYRFSQKRRNEKRRVL